MHMYSEMCVSGQAHRHVFRSGPAEVKGSAEGMSRWGVEGEHERG